MRNYKALKLPLIDFPLLSSVTIFAVALILTLVSLLVLSRETGLLYFISFALLSLSIFIVKKYISQGIFSWIVWLIIYFTIFTIIPLFYISLTRDFSYTYMEASGLFESESEIISYVVLAGAVYFLAIVCILIGYNSRLARNIGSRLPFFQSKWSHKRTFVAVVILSTIGLIGYIKYMEQLGGISFLITHMYMRWELEFHANQYLRMMAMFWGVGSFIWLAHNYAYGGSRIAHILLWIHMAVYIFFLFSLGLRGAIIYAVVMYCVLYNYLKRDFKISFSFLMLMIIVGSIIALTTYLRADHPDIGLQYLKILNGNYGGINQLAMMLKAVPEKLDFLMGQSLINVLFMPIPRSLWPEKPVGLGHMIAQAIWPGAHGGPAPYAVTEFFINFHIIGVVMAMIFIGFCGRIIYSYLVSNPRNPGVVLIYTTLLLSFGIGAISDFIVSYLQTIIPLALSLFFISGSIRKRK